MLNKLISILAAAVLCIGLPEVRADAQFRDSLHGLLSANAPQKALCNAYNDRLRAAERLDEANEGYLHKAAALRVLAVLADRPATHWSTKIVGGLLLIPIEEGDLHWLGSRVADMQPTCNLVGTFVNFRRLLRGHELLGFSNAETGRLRRSAVSYLKEETSYPSGAAQAAAMMGLASELHLARMLILDPGELQWIAGRTKALKALVRSHTRGDFNETIFARHLIEETRHSFAVAQRLQKLVAEW